MLVLVQSLSASAVVKIAELNLQPDNVCQDCSLLFCFILFCLHSLSLRPNSRVNRQHLRHQQGVLFSMMSAAKKDYLKMAVTAYTMSW